MFPSSCPENANLDLTLYFGAMDALEMWLPAMSTAPECNAKIFEIVTALNRDWLDLAARRLAAYAALPHQFGTCRSFGGLCTLYADFLQRAFRQKGVPQQYSQDCGDCSRTP
jgi:hypothetical protein